MGRTEQMEQNRATTEPRSIFGDAEMHNAAVDLLKINSEEKRLEEKERASVRQLEEARARKQELIVKLTKSVSPHVPEVTFVVGGQIVHVRLVCDTRGASKGEHREVAVTFPIVVKG